MEQIVLAMEQLGLEVEHSCFNLKKAGFASKQSCVGCGQVIFN